MKILDWAHLTGKDIDAIDRRRAIVTVSCSPLEVHGPHLPTITDNCEAAGLLDRTAALLSERRPELIFLRLPPIYVAADVLPHVGSIMFRSSTITRVLEDLGRSLAKQGFRRIWVGNFHGGPRHFLPIEVAAERANRRFGAEMISVFSLLVSRLTGGGSDLSRLLGDIDGFSVEALIGDSHGGAIETSMMLHLLGQHVKPSYADLEAMNPNLDLERRGLPPLEESKGRPSVRGILRGLVHKLKYYETKTYAGRPALARAEIGAEVIDRLAALSADALEELLDGQIGPDDCHSPLWKARWLFTARPIGWAFERAVRYQSPVW